MFPCNRKGTHLIFQGATDESWSSEICLKGNSLYAMLSTQGSLQTGMPHTVPISTSCKRSFCKHRYISIRLKLSTCAFHFHQNNQITFWDAYCLWALQYCSFLCESRQQICLSLSSTINKSCIQILDFFKTFNSTHQESCGVHADVENQSNFPKTRWNKQELSFFFYLV